MPNEPVIIHAILTGRTLCSNTLIMKLPKHHLFSINKEAINCKECLTKTSSTPIDPTKLVDLELSIKKNQIKPDHDKRQPSYDSVYDKMPFGKYKDKLLSDVPAYYLHWLWGQRPLSNKKLENYIHNNISALKLEHPDGIWS